MTPAARVDGQQLHAHLPPRPGPELDRVLDAVERCLARYGIERTSMSDIAREMGVARTTVYRQVPSLEDALALMTSRRFHRFLDEVLASTVEGISTDTFTQLIVRTVRSTLADPVAHRVLHDEPRLVGEYITAGSLAVLAGHITELLTPVVQAAMTAGLLPATDAAMTAGWIVRIVFALAVVPAPDEDLEATVRFVLDPLLGRGATSAADTAGPRRGRPRAARPPNA